MPKIAILGNMNNSMLPVLQIFLEKKYEAVLYSFTNEPNHFKPRKDTHNKNILRATKKFAADLDPSFPEFLMPAHRSKQVLLQKELSSYDFLVGTGQAPAIVHCIGRRLNIYAPYGSDLYHLPHLPKLPIILKILKPFINKSEKFFNFIFRPLEKHLNKYIFYNLAKHQIEGIKESKKIFLAGTSKDVIPKHLQETFREKSLPILIPMVGTYHFDRRKKKQGSTGIIQRQFNSLRSHYKFLIFHHSRHNWKKGDDPWSIKNNDILFRGFAKFLEKSRARQKACGLICFEYGPDVLASKNLCKRLGISQNVHWMKLMSRKDLMGGIILADLGVVEFGTTWQTGGVLFEFLASGIPVMQRYVENEITNARLASLPVIPANSAAEVCRALGVCFSQKDRLPTLGAKGKEWYEKEVRKNFSETLLRILKIEECTRTQK